MKTKLLSCFILFTSNIFGQVLDSDLGHLDFLDLVIHDSIVSDHQDSIGSYNPTHEYFILRDRFGVVDSFVKKFNGSNERRVEALTSRSGYTKSYIRYKIKNGTVDTFARFNAYYSNNWKDSILEEYAYINGSFLRQPIKIYSEYRGDGQLDTIFGLDTNGNFLIGRGFKYDSLGRISQRLHYSIYGPPGITKYYREDYVYSNSRLDRIVGYRNFQDTFQRDRIIDAKYNSINKVYECLVYQFLGGVKTFYYRYKFLKSSSFSTPKSNLQYLIVHPNPAINLINLNRPINGDLKIFDFNGKVVMVNEVENGQLDINQLQPGVYFLNIQSKDHLFIAKFIKQ